ncbi:B12-binding domain-containing radical SAM protein [Micromonospora sp. DT43]|uniref:B12-binding domain-containing radical SAM protein n=1 Tax=Micromonospora sp. DT43 TaxID=3393440 RepID=UPI003CF69FB7
MSADVVLIHPPFWDPYGPPASTAALLGHLRANSVPAAQIDFNQIFFAAQYDEIVGGSLSDLRDRDVFDSRVPHEHKVVLGMREFVPDVLRHHDIAESVLSLPRHRRAIAEWDMGRLNVLDAIVHYGYFVRQDPDIGRLMADPGVLDHAAWKPMRELFLSRVMPLIRREEPVVVGLSLLGEQQLVPSIAISYWLREAGFDGIILWGGSDIRYTHEKAGRPESWWRDLPDFLCLGEGESAILGLARRARAAQQTHGPGWRRTITISRNPRDANFIGGLIPQPLERALLPVKRYEQVNTLAQYDYTGFDLHDGYLMPWPVVPYQGSRGCHWGICAFCDHEEGYRLHYRPKTSTQVVDHMEDLRNRFGVTHLQFVDEAIEPQWMTDLNDEIERRDLAGVFRWSNYSKIAKEVDYDSLRRSYANGCRLILFGVESFQQRVLNVVRKGIRRADIFQTLRDVDRAGIRSWVWLISGLPSQTPAEVRADIADLQSLRGVVDAVSVGRYRISANSDVFRETEKFGIVSYDLNHPMDLTFQVQGEIVRPEELAELFYREYYPTAVDMSVSHNRYLLFAEAIKEESGTSASGSTRARPVAPAATARPAAVQTGAQAGLGNI